ncbi:HAMP domain-containing sensor histidine kinase [Flaviaesturariibacter amylovorans]|uniref:histidine kinase n=1 Tax=Flaviaesturariibacter amylovorans TaxID=1084520 RepID=A0ABP8GIZ8_9BACT
MTFSQYPARILLRTLLLFVSLLAAAVALAKGLFILAALIAPLIAWQLWEFVRYQAKTREELDQFIESIHYRDFSRQFDVRHAPADLQSLRRGFNEITSAFKVISKEKETQYQYLQKILELVDTGILSYELDSGDVVWMNDALRRMLQLPYLRNITSLGRRDASLAEEVTAIRPGEVRIVTAHLERGRFRLLLSATLFQTEGKRYKLIAFQNANEALDETESKAWEKLLSVLTHEIMNSIAPISSLAETLKHRLQQKDDSIFEDLELGIDTIRRRSEGLLQFAETYRHLNRITTLNRRHVYLRELFGNLHGLMQPTFEQKGIELEIILRDPELALEADASLLEQVLINLLVNAIEAVKERPAPRIVLSAEPTANGRVQLRLADNGPGIPEEILDKIFVPFFSTRKTGSGIGLSLCKQIVLLHKGTIQVQSVPGTGTAFLITLDKGGNTEQGTGNKEQGIKNRE